MNNNNENENNNENIVKQVTVSLDKPIDPSILEKLNHEINAIRKTMLAIIVTESLKVKCACDKYGFHDLAEKCMCIVPQKMYDATKHMLEGDGACVVIDENAMAAILKPLFSLISVLLVNEDMNDRGIYK
jgi:hypothetical protein